MNPARILVVEDEAIVCMDLQSRLAAMDYQCIGTASTGPQAIALAGRLRPDLVLMDIRLDGPMDGIEAAEQIRDQWRLPVVFVTAFAEEDTLQRAKLARPGGSVIKPIKDRELRTCIETALYRHQAEEKIQHLTRLYATLCQVNQTIFHGTSPTRLFHEICRIAIEFGQFEEAWIGMTRPGALNLEMVAQANRSSLKIDSARAADCQLAAQVMAENQAVVWNDLDRDAPTISARERGRQMGHQSSAGFPIHSEDQPIGVLRISSREPGFFQETEIKLLDEVVLDISFALENIAKEEKRRGLEADLRKSEAFQRTLVECSPLPIFRIDLEGSVLSWNTSAETILGWRADEVIGRSLPIISEDQQAEFADARRQLQTGPGFTEWEFVCRRKNGSLLDANVSMGPIRNDAGETGGIVVTLLDITDQKAARSRLELLQHAIDMSSEGICITGSYAEDASVLFVNQGFAAMTGYPAEEMKGRNMRILQGPHTDPRFIQEFSVAVKNGTVFKGECLNYRKDGSVFWNRISVSPIRDEQGIARNFIGVSCDVTQQKLMELELRASEKRFRSLVEMAPYAIFVQTHGRFAFLNPAAVQLFGAQDPNQLLGTPVIDRFGAECQSAVRERIRQLNEFRKPVPRAEERCLKLDGSEVMVQVVAAPVDYEDTSSALVIASDITQQLKAQKFLRLNQERLRRTQAVGRVGSWEYDLQSGMIWASEEGVHMFGLPITDQEIPIETIEACIPERERVHAALEHLVNDGTHYDLEYEVRPANGNPAIFVNSIGELLRDDLGKPVKIIGVVIDITERKKVAEQLRASELRYRSLFEKSPVLIWEEDFSRIKDWLEAKRQTGVLDFRSYFREHPDALLNCAKLARVTAVNEASLKFYGAASKAELVQQLPHYFKEPKAWEVFQDELIALARGEKSFRSEIPIQKLTGERALLDIQLTLVPDEQDSWRNVLVSFFDLTELRRVEANLRQLTDQILRIQDEERRKLGRELHDSTAQDLVAISLNLSLLNRHLASAPPKAHQLMNDCLTLIEKASQEIRSLSFLLHPPLLESAGLVKTVDEYVSGYAQRSPIGFDFQAGENFPRLAREVEFTLFRIVQESLNNIHRHSQANQCWIRLNIVGQCVELSIRDNGCGLAAELVETYRNGTSVGLGVGILGMRERLRQHQGQLVIQSGPGTTIQATVPLCSRL